jgi:hypothetical protein
MSGGSFCWAVTVPVKHPLDRLWLIVLSERSGSCLPRTREWSWCTFDVAMLRKWFGKDDLSKAMHASLHRLIRAGFIEVEALGETMPGVQVRFTTGLEMPW